MKHRKWNWHPKRVGITCGIFFKVMVELICVLVVVVSSIGLADAHAVLTSIDPEEKNGFENSNPHTPGTRSSRPSNLSPDNPASCYGHLNADEKKQLQEELANIYSNYRNNEEKLKSALGRYLERHVGPDGGGKKGVETIALAAEAFKKFKEVSQFSDALSSLSRGEKVSDPSLSKKIENIKADYETLAKAGFKFDSKEQKWDLSGVSQWIDLSQQNSSLKAAMSNLISPDLAQKVFDPNRKESLALGEMVIRPPVGKYIMGGNEEKKVRVLTKKEQDKDVEKEISKFMDYKGDYIRASKESIGNSMTGKIWEMVGFEHGHNGMTPSEIERDGSLKGMSDSIKFMKETLGVEHSAVAPLYSSLHRAIDVDSAGLAALDKDLTQKINTLKTTAYVLGAATAVAVTGGLAAPAVFSAAVVGASGTITAAAGTALAFQAIPAAINIGIDVASGKSVSCAAMDELSKRGINAVSSAVIAGAMGAGGSALSGGIAQIPGRAGQFAQGAMALPGLYFAGQGALGVVNNGRLTYNMLEEAKQAEKRGESARAAELRKEALKLGAETAINLGESLYGAVQIGKSLKGSRAPEENNGVRQSRDARNQSLPRNKNATPVDLDEAAKLAPPGKLSQETVTQVLENPNVKYANLPEPVRAAIGQMVHPPPKTETRVSTEEKRGFTPAANRLLPYYQTEEIEKYRNILKNVGFTNVDESNLQKLLQKLAEKPASKKRENEIAIQKVLEQELGENSLIPGLLHRTTRWLRDQIKAGETLPIVKQGRGIADRFPPSVEIDALSLAEAQAARKMSEKHHVEFLYIGDRAVYTGLKLKSDRKVCDIVAVSEKGNSFHLGEVKASSGKNGAEVDTAIQQLNSTAQAILNEDFKAKFETVSVYLPKRAVVRGNYEILGDQLFRVSNDVRELVTVQGKPVRVVWFGY